MDVLLHAVGDIGIVGRLAERVAREPTPFPFQGVAETLAAADIVFGNLEIPFSGGAPIVAHESPRFETPEIAAQRLAAAGFQVLSIANNHIMDFGATGLATTRRLLSAVGIRTVGAGADLGEARQPLILERRGRRIGFLAYCVPCGAIATANSPGAAPLEIELIEEDLAALRSKADCLVVSVHFGMIYLEHPAPADIELARSILRAGADLVLGHHPHVLQGIESDARGIVAYSLGEFVFDPQAGNYYARIARQTRRRGMIFRAALGERIKLLPPLPTLAGGDLCPRLLDGDAAQQALASLDFLSRALYDPAARRTFWQYAGRQLLAYQLSGLWFAVRRGQWGYLVTRLTRIRGRHVRLVAGFLAGLFKRDGRVASSR